MRYDKVQHIEVATGATAEEFKKDFNRCMDELQGLKILDTQIKVDDGFSAVILFEMNKQAPARTVADEYHDQGLVYLCRQCPHIPLPKDGRVRHVDCKYDELGSTHLDRECCEMFYKELKQGAITPRWLR